MVDKDGIRLCNSTDIFNILNQTDISFPRLSDPNYLLLLDTRKRKEYNESHILTAKFAPRSETGVFYVPYEAELQTKRYCIVYDSYTNSLSNKGSPAVSCARMLWDMGSKNSVIIIKGGYEEFSALYPFLRTQKIIYTQKELEAIETYPVEVIPGFLYSGTLRQGQDLAIMKALKVKAHVNVSLEQDVFKPDLSQHATKTFNVPLQDLPEADMYSYFQAVVDFIDAFSNPPGQSVLVCSELNLSRSITVVIAYLIWKKKWKLEVQVVEREGEYVNGDAGKTENNWRIKNTSMEELKGKERKDECVGNEGMNRTINSHRNLSEFDGKGRVEEDNIFNHSFFFRKLTITLKDAK